MAFNWAPPANGQGNFPPAFNNPAQPAQNIANGGQAGGNQNAAAPAQGPPNPPPHINFVNMGANGAIFPHAPNTGNPFPPPVIVPAQPFGANNPFNQIPLPPIPAVPQAGIDSDDEIDSDDPDFMDPDDADDHSSKITMRISVPLHVKGCNNIVAIDSAKISQAISKSMVDTMRNVAAGSNGLPMIDAYGNPRQLSVNVNCNVVVDGDRNVVGERALITTIPAEARRTMVRTQATNPVQYPLAHVDPEEEETIRGIFDRSREALARQSEAETPPQQNHSNYGNYGVFGYPSSNATQPQNPAALNPHAQAFGPGSGFTAAPSSTQGQAYAQNQTRGPGPAAAYPAQSQGYGSGFATGPSTSIFSQGYSSGSAASPSFTQGQGYGSVPLTVRAPLQSQSYGTSTPASTSSQGSAYGTRATGPQGGFQGHGYTPSPTPSYTFDTSSAQGDQDMEDEDMQMLNKRPRGS